jgi:hypothetical protein
MQQLVKGSAHSGSLSSLPGFWSFASFFLFSLSFLGPFLFKEEFGEVSSKGWQVKPGPKTG